jgi:sulfonate transport system substrate-binding protein
MLGLILLLPGLTIAVSGPPTSPEYLPIRLADALGYFTDAGLSVTLRSTRADAGAAEALAQRQADLAATSVEAALRFGAAKNGEAPLIVFGLTAAPPVVLAVPAAVASTTRSAADLVGTTVGISSPGAPEQTWFLAVLSRAGLRVTQVGLVSYGELALAGALGRGEVRAGLVDDPQASRLLASGAVTALIDFRDPEASRRALGRPTVHAALFESARHRLPSPQVEAVARALLRALGTLETASPAELALRLPPQVVGLPDDFATRLAGSRKIYLPQGLVDLPALEATVDMVREHVPLPRVLHVPPIAEMLRLGPLRRVLTPGGAR